MNNIKIVFLGQLRNWDNFINQIKLIRGLNDSSISISYFVDDDELSQDQEEILVGLLDNLVRLKPPSEGELLEFDPLMLSRSAGIRNRSGGMRRASLWRQLIDLNRVYSFFSNDDYIIRTRTDIDISTDFLKSIILKINRGELYNKVWVQWWNILEPFYIHDTAFAGRLFVLRKYIDESANLSLAKFYPTNSLPVFFWILPYVEEEWVKIWLQKYSKRKPNITFLAKRDFRFIIRRYIALVNENFCVEFGEIYWYVQWSTERRMRIWKNYYKLLGPLNLLIGRVFVEFNFKVKK